MLVFEELLLVVQILIYDLLFVLRLEVVSGSFVLVDVEVKCCDVPCFEGGLQTRGMTRFWIVFLLIGIVSFCVNLSCFITLRYRSNIHSNLLS